MKRFDWEKLLIWTGCLAFCAAFWYGITNLLIQTIEVIRG